MPNSPGFRGRALITGATSGIGLATAKKFVAEGYEVGILAESPTLVDTVVAELNRERVVAFPVHADLSKPDQVAGLIESLESSGKPLDVLVNNAGIGLKSDVMDIRDADLRLLIEVNLISAMTLSRDALKYMSDRKSGNIIQVSSAAARRGLPGMGVYSTTKAGLHLFSESMRVEAAIHNVHVSELLPMTVRTPFFENAKNSSKTKYEGSNFSVTPERVADLIFRAVKHPAPEIYTSTLARIVLAINGINPKMMDWILIRKQRKEFQKSE